ncbi:hypothetical protein BGX29_002292 [Mortierella sp. GBA35]|nr:hypothetical protein BGX29_002292 [Mortierella sp. GBA35]
MSSSLSTSTRQFLGNMSLKKLSIRSNKSTSSSSDIDSDSFYSHSNSSEPSSPSSTTSRNSAYSLFSTTSTYTDLDESEPESPTRKSFDSSKFRRRAASNAGSIFNNLVSTFRQQSTLRSSRSQAFSRTGSTNKKAKRCVSAPLILQSPTPSSNSTILPEVVVIGDLPEYLADDSFGRNSKGNEMYARTRLVALREHQQVLVGLLSDLQVLEQYERQEFESSMMTGDNHCERECLERQLRRFQKREAVIKDYRSAILAFWQADQTLCHWLSRYIRTTRQIGRGLDYMLASMTAENGVSTSELERMGILQCRLLEHSPLPAPKRPLSVSSTSTAGLQSVSSFEDYDEIEAAVFMGHHLQSLSKANEFLNQFNEESTRSQLVKQKFEVARQVFFSII